MFGKRRNVYRRVSQLEAENLASMVKFWLNTIEHYLVTDKNNKNNKNIKFNVTSVVSDFLTLYELNRKVITRIDKSTIRVREKNIILSPLEKCSWLINVADNSGQVTQHNADPKQLGMSILNMFAIGPFKQTLEPDLLMAICYYFEP